MAKLRAVEVPRFDPDWDRHMESVREIVDTIQRHETAARELSVRIESTEAEVDREVFILFGLEDADITRIRAFRPRTVDAQVHHESPEPDEEANS